jgi:hypothetical protein
MLRKLSGLSRLSSKLMFELLPGAAVSALGGLLLNQYYIKPPVAPQAAAVSPASAEIVQVVRDEQARFFAYLKKDEDEKAAAREPKPEAKIVASAAHAVEKRNAKPQRTAKAPVGQPLQLTAMASYSAPAQPVAPAPVAAATTQDNVLVAKWRDVTTTVQQIPTRVRSAATGWFSDEAPPRPPAPIPGQNFLNASM